ncbi:hypothetical protein [Tolypothrix sp. NIES-4075]|nr:hypothetical protein [Tolypothrix sp. NIES-4075]
MGNGEQCGETSPLRSGKRAIDGGLALELGLGIEPNRASAVMGHG